MCRSGSCEKFGDVIQFIQDIKDVDFKEACEILIEEYEYAEE